MHTFVWYQLSILVRLGVSVTAFVFESLHHSFYLSGKAVGTKCPDTALSSIVYYFGIHNRWHAAVILASRFWLLPRTYPLSLCLSTIFALK